MLTINLLPNHDRKVSVGNITMGLLQLLLIAAAIGLILASIWLQTAVRGVSTQVAAKQSEKAQYKTSLDKAAELQQKLQNIVDRQAEWKKIEADNGHFGDLLASVALATPEKLRINSFSIKASAVSISGVAATRTDITNFVDGLNKTDKLSDITLSQANSTQEGVTFALTAKLKSKASPSPKASSTP